MFHVPLTIVEDIDVKVAHFFMDCADSTLEILKIQPEGKPKMKASTFIAGYEDIDRAVLE